MGIEWTDAQLKSAGIPKRRLASLLRKFGECERLGLSVYAADGSGYLVHRSRPEHDEAGRADTGAIVARIGYGFDGGGW